MSPRLSVLALLLFVAAPFAGCVSITVTSSPYTQASPYVAPQQSAQPYTSQSTQVGSKDGGR